MKLTLSLLITTLIFSGCTMGKNNSENIHGDNTSEKPITISIEQELTNTSVKIKDTTEFQDCVKQQINTCVQTTGMQIAQKNKDPKFCKELGNLEQQVSCEFAVTMINAQENNNIALCDTLSNEVYKQQCKTQIYKQNAILKNDITLCDSIDITIPKTNSGGINHQENTQKDQCIMQFVMNIPTAKEIDCERILDESTYGMCKIMIKEKQKGIKNLQNSTSIQK